VSKSKLPADVIDYWPEVFEHIEIKAVPVKYISSVHVTFQDGKEWDIEFDESKKSSDKYLEKTINTFFKEYNDVISKVEFKLDTPNLVNDVKSQTKTFMKRS
jgi:hypothetical protein|tara:strand:- start:424 stop:729 length:306 start_codon:yes stop_codon:yes gene_type:complete